MTTWTPRPDIALSAAASGADERLALAGLHLRDAALVEHDGAHQLDVERTHAQLAAGDLAGGREDVRQDVVEGGLEVA